MIYKAGSLVWLRRSGEGHILRDLCFQGGRGPGEFVSLSWQSCDFLPCLLQSEEKTVKMMNQKGVFRVGFIEEVRAQILEMQYIQGKLSMFILLPSHSADNLEGLQEVNLRFPVSLTCLVTGLQREHHLPPTLLRQGDARAVGAQQRLYKTLNPMTSLSYLLLIC